MKQIEKESIDKLFTSFSELEIAINNAKKVLLAKTDSTKGLIDRINSYDEILKKQKELGTMLYEKLESREWEAVSRIVSLINGLSYMLRDDSKEILRASSLNENIDIQEKQVC